MEAKIKLKVKDVEIEMSIEEAKELKTILEGLTGKEIVKEVIREHYHEHYHDYWNDWWHRHYPYDVTWTCDRSNAITGSAQYTAELSNNIQVSYSI